MRWLTVLDGITALTSRLLPVVGTLYLLYLVTQPPPARWVGLVCLAILTPFAVGWVAGRVFDVGPWAE